MSKKKTFPFLAETDQDHGVDDRHQRDEKDERNIAYIMEKQCHCRKRAQGTDAHRQADQYGFPASPSMSDRI